MSNRQLSCHSNWQLPPAAYAFAGIVLSSVEGAWRIGLCGKCWWQLESEYLASTGAGLQVRQSSLAACPGWLGLECEFWLKALVCCRPSEYYLWHGAVPESRRLPCSEVMHRAACGVQGTGDAHSHLSDVVQDSFWKANLLHRCEVGALGWERKQQHVFIFMPQRKRLHFISAFCVLIKVRERWKIKKLINHKWLFTSFNISVHFLLLLF